MGSFQRTSNDRSHYSSSLSIVMAFFIRCYSRLEQRQISSKLNVEQETFHQTLKKKRFFPLLTSNLGCDVFPFVSRFCQIVIIVGRFVFIKHIVVTVVCRLNSMFSIKGSVQQRINWNHSRRISSTGFTVV